MTEGIHIGQPPAAPLPPARPQRRIWPLAVAGAALLVAITAGTTAWLVGGGNAVPSQAVPTFAQTSFTITGEMTLPRGDFQWSSGLDTCWGQRGYDDMSGGTQVVVTDESGKTLAVGKLQTGVADRDPQDPTHAIRCRLKFEVTGVPEGAQFYRVEVGRRGELQYARDDLNRPLSLVLN